MTRTTALSFEDKKAIHAERMALAALCPGLFQSLWCMGLMLGLDIETYEPVAAFAKRLNTKLDDICDRYDIYDEVDDDLWEMDDPSSISNTP